MTGAHPKDPLHGVTLERMVTRLVERHGFEELGKRIPVRCFQLDPTVKSSLTFLRRTPWARAKIEELYRAQVWPKGEGEASIPGAGGPEAPIAASSGGAGEGSPGIDASISGARAPGHEIDASIDRARGQERAIEASIPRSRPAD